MGAVVLGRLTEVPRSRLVGWAILVTALALLSYSANIADSGDTPDDLLFRWSSAIGGLVQYAIILGIVLAIARGIAPAALGLVRPASWARAAGRVATALVSIWVIGAVLNVFLEAGKEQGLVPDEWDSGRAAPFVARALEHLQDIGDSAEVGRRRQAQVVHDIVGNPFRPATFAPAWRTEAAASARISRCDSRLFSVSAGEGITVSVVASGTRNSVNKSTTMLSSLPV